MYLSKTSIHTKDVGIAKEWIEVIIYSLILSLAAFARINLWFTPIPFVLQNSLAVFLPFILGTRKACYSIILFLFQGAIGLPVFSGFGGLWVLLGPSGGYLFGYLIAAFFSSIAYKKMQKTTLNAFLAMTLGHFIVYLCGWSRLLMYISPMKAFLLGVCPFILGGFFKAIVLIKSYSYFK